MQLDRVFKTLASSSLVMAAVLAGLPSHARADASDRKAGSDVYLVRVLGEPVVAYQGSIPGLKATKPGKGQKLDPNQPDVVKYVRHLDARHDAVLAKAGGTKIYGYQYTFNGFAARLTPSQLARIKADPNVLSVEKDTIRQMDTSTTPSFLGLTAPDGLWNPPLNLKGENIIIGVIDTGIWPENPSFSDRTGTNPAGVPGKLAYHHIPGWHGKCARGEAFNASHCNQKLIGARFYLAGRSTPPLPHEFLSPRDFNGHG
ncbi:MAG TPA: S8 family serine peptidase, partial [Myxococcaceae bacterium]|nr:S8 family serine peptidase [Myxococcaceae bacterium]